MTLRDYFAAAACTGVITARCKLDIFAEDVARWSYETADAMLAEREKAK